MSAGRPAFRQQAQASPHAEAAGTIIRCLSRILAVFSSREKFMYKTLLRAIPPATLACAIMASPAFAKSHSNTTHGDVCKPFVTAVGEGATGSRARTHAIAAWKTKVSSDLGADYANPDDPKAKSVVRCHKIHVGKHSCTLKARPCHTSEGEHDKHSR
jgi:hypothetical protein